MGCGASRNSVESVLDQPTAIGVVPGESNGGHPAVELPATGPSPGCRSTDEDLSATSTPLSKPVEHHTLPLHKQDMLPHWERLEPLPRLGSSTQRRSSQSAAGKLVVKQTDKQRQLAAEAKKKRGDDNESNPKSMARRGSALPPLGERKSLRKTKSAVVDSADSGCTRSSPKWKGASGGESWEVLLPGAQTLPGHSTSRASTLEAKEDASIQQQVAQQVTGRVKLSVKKL